MADSLPDIYPNQIGDEAYADFQPLIDMYGDPIQTEVLPAPLVLAPMVVSSGAPWIDDEGTSGTGVDSTGPWIDDAVISTHSGVDDTGPWLDNDIEASNPGTLNIYLHALAIMYKQVDDVSKDGDADEPGWSQIFDLTRAKTEWLPWIGNITGYPVPVKPDTQTLAEYDAAQRERLVTRSTQRRGTVSMLLDVVREQMNPPQRVVLRERYGGDPWRMHLTIFNDDIATSQAEIEAAARAQKLAGIIFDIDFVNSTDLTYAILLDVQGDYSTVLSKFADYNELKTNPGKP